MPTLHKTVPLKFDWLFSVPCSPLQVRFDFTSPICFPSFPESYQLVAAVLLWAAKDAPWLQVSGKAHAIKVGLWARNLFEVIRREPGAVGSGINWKFFFLFSGVKCSSISARKHHRWWRLTMTMTTGDRSNVNNSNCKLAAYLSYYRISPAKLTISHISHGGDGEEARDFWNGEF